MPARQRNNRNALPAPAVRLAAAVLLAGLFAPAASAQQAGGQATEYRDCMRLARERPNAGFDKATAWRGLGGGAAADHCAAVALIGLGHHSDAARRLERLAGAVVEEPDFKAQLLAQAGQAWLLADAPERANAVLTTALGLKPDDPAMLVDRAQARAAAEDYRGTLADLDRAIEIDPERPYAYVFRAAANRYLDRISEAQADVVRALRLNPNHVEGLLERGILRRLEGDRIGARRDWVRVVELAPESDAARTARRNIELMDVEADR